MCSAQVKKPGNLRSIKAPHPHVSKGCFAALVVESRARSAAVCPEKRGSRSVEANEPVAFINTQKNIDMSQQRLSKYTTNRVVLVSMTVPSGNINPLHSLMRALQINIINPRQLNRTNTHASPNASVQRY